MTICERRSEFKDNLRTDLVDIADLRLAKEGIVARGFFRIFQRKPAVFRISKGNTVGTLRVVGSYMDLRIAAACKQGEGTFLNFC